jgi:hypothetical protein
MGSEWEAVVATLYERNLVLSLPVTILCVKLFVRVIAREARKDI